MVCGAHSIATIHLHYSGEDILREQCAPRVSTPEPQQVIHALLGIKPLPAPHRRPTVIGAPGEFRITDMFCRHQNNFCSLNVFERASTIQGDLLYPLAVLGPENNICVTNLKHRLQHHSELVNSMW